jgi:flavin reductase (DIM6/NTAB) family NADH-FMN oxidoreductase RutF
VTAPLTEDFRAVMAGVATPVSVVTTLTDGRPHGTTVSAFASLSMSPPMVLVSLDRSSELLARLAHGSVFKGSGKFTGVDWVADAGAPRLTGSPGWLACTVSRLVEGGDHVIVLGEVQRAATTEAAPLTYHARTFGTHARVA